MVNADYISDMLQEVGVPYPVEVSVMLDSPLWVDIPSPPSAGPVVPLLNQTEMVYQFANVDERLGEDCMAFYAGAPWKCLFGAPGIPWDPPPASASALFPFLGCVRGWVFCERRNGGRSPHGIRPSACPQPSTGCPTSAPRTS